MPPDLAVGLIVSRCVRAVLHRILIHLPAKGDVARPVTLTAINSVITVFYHPDFRSIGTHTIT